MEKKNRSKIPKSFNKWLLKRFSDLSLIDVKAYYDFKLSVSENKTEFKAKFSNLYNPTKKETTLEAKNDEYNIKRIMQKAIREEEEKLLNEWKKSTPQKIKIKSFEIPQHFIKMTCRGITTGTFLVGEGGIGKTFLSIQVMKQELKPQDWVYLNTYSTPLAFYKFLYRNKNKKLLLDDVFGLLQNEKSVSILKSALWEVDGKRIVCMETTSKSAEDVPSLFEFTGQIIILANKVNIRDVNINALVSRVNYYDFKMSYKEKIEIMRQIVKEPYKDTTLAQRKIVLDTLINVTSVTTKNLNFRTLIKAIDYYTYDKKKYQELLQATLEIDEEMEVVKTAVEEYRTLKEQYNYYKEVVGKSKRTFQRKKKEYLEMIK